MTRFEFRPMVAHDIDELLTAWFTEPEVFEWWDHPDASATTLATKYLPRLAPDTVTRMWIILVDGEPAGMCQSYLHTDHPETDELVGVDDAVGIDYLLGAAARGRGLGGPMLRALARHALTAHPGATVCVATPDRTNEPSWRALEHAGFERVGTSHPPGQPPEWIYVTTRGV